ncbi:MAG: hypothetical protein DMG65_14955 [Candidatus Angelobacter sp. Gp1-AA117]|nr:MAG: hypothetical protein DMG65_14955 [Candidatus Angelobacter sp. Gp1-AA117]
MAAYRVIITPGAKSDLRAICRYIRRHAPQAAKVWLKGVHQSIKSLKQYPERAALAPESFAFHEPVRELFYGQGNRGTYRILFVIRHAFIHVFMSGMDRGCHWAKTQKKTNNVSPRQCEPHCSCGSEMVLSTVAHVQICALRCLLLDRQTDHL